MTTKIWYVATSGADGNPGTGAAPFRTIGRAASVVNPGEQIQIRGGTYNEIVTLARGGTASRPVLVRNYGSELVAVDGTGRSPAEGLFNITAPYIAVQGLVVQNSNKYGLEVRSHHCTVRNCVIQHIFRAGLITSDVGSSIDISHNTYDGNDISDTCRQNLNGAMLPQGGGWDSAINGYHGGGGSHGFGLYTSNYVHDNWGEGTTAHDDDIFRANRFKDNWSVNIYLDGKQRVTVERNLIWARDNSAQATAGRKGIGVGFADEQDPARLTGCTVRNNIILNCATGINFWNAGRAGSGLKSTVIDCNTVVNTTSDGVSLDSGSHSASTFRNNIVWPRTGTAISGTGAAGITSATNLVKGTNTSPALVGIGSATDFDPNHYKVPNTSSSAYNAGTNSGAPSNDYFGTARPQHTTVDIGAHELI